jgi:hypothetical protein
LGQVEAKQANVLPWVKGRLSPGEVKVQRNFTETYHTVMMAMVIVAESPPSHVGSRGNGIDFYAKVIVHRRGFYNQEIAFLPFFAFLFWLRGMQLKESRVD